MTNTEWNDALEFLLNASEGDWVEHNGRTIIIVDMCGGNYALFEDKEFYELTDDIGIAMLFLAKLK